MSSFTLSAGLKALGCRLARVAIVAVVGLSLIAGARPAAAQMWGQGPDMGDSITRRGLKAYGDMLKLDDSQREAATALLEGHKTAQQALQKKMQEKLQEIQTKAQETGDWTVFQTDWPKQAKAIAEKSEELEKSFFADLKGLLNADQEDRWTKVERYRRREKGMRFSFASGATADLVAISMRVKSTPDGAAGAEYAALLDQYETEMDRVMVTLDTKGKDMQKNMAEPGAMMNPAKIGEMMKEFYDVAKQARDLNRDYSRRLMPLMSDSTRAAFDLEMKRRSTPRVYKESYADKLFTASLEMKDLDAAQKESLQGLKEAYHRDRGPIDEKWAKAIETQEEEAGGSINVMMRGMMGQNNAKENPVKDAREARKELDDKMIEKIKAALSETQRAKLPEKKIEPMNPMADMMPNEEADE